MSVINEVATMPETQNHVQPIMEVVHLRKEFPLRQLNVFGPKRAVHAVEDATFALYPGRATALVGESGSGKTTIARILARLYYPTSGSILYRGEPIKLTGGSATRKYRRHVQMIFQDPFSSLNPIHTVRYHLSRPLRVFGHTRTHDEETQQILSLLNRVSLTPAEQFIQKYPHAGGAAGDTTGRRAGLDARCLHSPRHAQPAAAPEKRGATGLPLHHPRHRQRPLLR